MRHRTIRLAHLGLSMLLAPACASSPEWTCVDPDRLWATCIGEVISIDLNPDGLSLIVVSPDTVQLLAPGQQLLPCVLTKEGFDSGQPILAKMRVGDHVEASGYWVAHRVDDTVEHQINQVTSIRILSND